MLEVGRKAPFSSLMLGDRRISLVVFAAVAAQIGLVLAGLPGWQCPFLHLTGTPCPGCGLSRASVSLINGDVQTSLALHAFAPVLFLGLLAIGAACFLPRRGRERFVAAAARFERRTRVSFVLAAAFVLYWLARLLFFTESLARLTKG